MSGRAARIKGHTFERKIAGQLRPMLGQAKRGLQSRNDVDNVEDVQCPLFSIECKAYKRNAPIRRGYEQAVKNCRPGKMPLAITKEDHKTVLATASYEDFRALVAVMIDMYKEHVKDDNWEKTILDKMTAAKLKHKEDDRKKKPEV
jgi:hypothetical protein